MGKKGEKKSKNKGVGLDFKKVKTKVSTLAARNWS